MVKVIDKTACVVHEREKAGPKTVGELIGELVTPAGSTATCYAMVFLGKKLQREKTLAEVEHLADGHTVQLVRQREEPKKVLNESQANATIAECKKMVKQVRTNQDYSRHIRMQTYTQRNMASIVSLFPSLISSVSATRLGLSSGVGGGGSSAPLRPLDAVVDLRLLLLMISKRHPFIYEHPECLVVLKRALEYALEGTQQAAAPPAAVAGGSGQGGGAGGGGLITSQMLQQALAAALTGAPAVAVGGAGQVATSGGDLHTLEHYRNLYREQLAQMADFGFTEEPQNIEALRVSDGSVEQALQLVIDNARNRDLPMDHQPS